MEANSLIDIYSGERKYLNREERQSFKTAVKDMEPKIQTFCLMIYYTGCRLNEALEVTPNRLDFDEQRVLLRTLKQNKQKPDKPDRYRLVELPSSFLASLESNFQARSRKGTHTGNIRIWSFTDRTGQNYIKKVMDAAGISGIRASSRGLRHSMGVILALEKVPVNVIQDILGHKFPESTQIYLQVIGEDRRRLIASVW